LHCLFRVSNNHNNNNNNDNNNNNKNNNSSSSTRYRAIHAPVFTSSCRYPSGGYTYEAPDLQSVTVQSLIRLD